MTTHFVLLSDDGMLCTSRQQVIDQRYPVVSTYLLKERGTCTDYGHTRAKFPILNGPNSNSNPKQIFGNWM